MAINPKIATGIIEKPANINTNLFRMFIIN